MLFGAVARTLVIVVGVLILIVMLLNFSAWWTVACRA